MSDELKVKGEDTEDYLIQENMIQLGDNRSYKSRLALEVQKAFHRFMKLKQ